MTSGAIKQNPLLSMRHGELETNLGLPCTIVSYCLVYNEVVINSDTLRIIYGRNLVKLKLYIKCLLTHIKAIYIQAIIETHAVSCLQYTFLTKYKQ